MKKPNVLVTGGAGFIGVNTCAMLLDRGFDLIVIDNLSRKGTADNLLWLKSKGKFKFYQADTRDDKKMVSIFKKHNDLDLVIHLAGQVAVTTSITNPREDFEINALGTFNVLEAIRKSGSKPLVIYASTNKVYGGMEHIKTVKKKTRYEYRDYPKGISENVLLDFHSPYGCSKGCADQYVRDYSRIYNIPTVVFRQSCIYGPRQFGIEDQGWVAWFIIAVICKKPITIYGDGRQVRDILYVDDLARAYIAAFENKAKVAGKVINVGGGPKNTMSIWCEFQKILEDITGEKIEAKYSDWRAGDQPVYISDISLAKKLLNWSPKTTPVAGIKKLYDWVSENQDQIKAVLK
ncbi:MAG: SDR family NAD(P)-dependent oxidoreductase [Candidatus Berkelbacteria bacterium]